MKLFLREGFAVKARSSERVLEKQKPAQRAGLEAKESV